MEKHPETLAPRDIKSRLKRHWLGRVSSGFRNALCQFIDPYFEVLLFLGWLLPRLIGRIFRKRAIGGPLERYVTYGYTPEGIGGMVIRYTAAVAISKIFGIKYVHKKFPADFHTPEMDFDRFLGFGQNDMKLEELPDPARLKKIVLPRFQMLAPSAKIEKFLLHKVFRDVYAENGLLFELRGYSGVSPLVYNSVLEEIHSEMRQKYWRQRERYPMPFPFSKDKIRIAVQIRRGEVSSFWDQGLRQGSSFVPTRWFETVLEKALGFLGEDAVEIKIFSDEKDKGALAAFYARKNTSVLLSHEDKEQPLKAIHAMACADILVCSNSCFSLLGGWLSSGLKIIRSDSAYQYETNPSWIAADALGNFDVRKLEAYRTRT